MDDMMRVELPLRAPSNILSSCKTIGELNRAYPKIRIHKYIYLDPKDNKLKGVNPPKNLPLVKDSYITLVGPYEEVIRFAKDSVSK